MNIKETLTLQELEELSQAYMDCRLSRLEEEELELVLLCSDLTSPILDEVRGVMGLTARLTACKASESIRKKSGGLRVFRYAGIAAAIAVVSVCAIGYLRGSDQSKDAPEVYVCVDGEVLSGYVAQTIVSETEEESMNMLRSVIEDAENEQRLTTQYMNSLTE